MNTITTTLTRDPPPPPKDGTQAAAHIAATIVYQATRTLRTYPALAVQRAPLDGLETQLVWALGVPAAHVVAVYTRWYPPGKTTDADSVTAPRIARPARLRVWLVLDLFVPEKLEELDRRIEALEPSAARSQTVIEVHRIGLRDREPLIEAAVCVWVPPRTPADEAAFVRRLLGL